MSLQNPWMNLVIIKFNIPALVPVMHYKACSHVIAYGLLSMKIAFVKSVKKKPGRPKRGSCMFIHSIRSVTLDSDRHY